MRSPNPARQGVVIFVPRGDARDLTRLPEFYDFSAAFLAECAVPMAEGLAPRDGVAREGPAAGEIPARALEPARRLSASMGANPTSVAKTRGAWPACTSVNLATPHGSARGAQRASTGAP
jgi:hypothetical protein